MTYNEARAKVMVAVRSMGSSRLLELCKEYGLPVVNSHGNSFLRESIERRLIDAMISRAMHKPAGTYRVRYIYEDGRRLYIDCYSYCEAIQKAERIRKKGVVQCSAVHRESGAVVYDWPEN